MSGLPELHGYHVHIYYNDATLPIAAKLRELAGVEIPGSGRQEPGHRRAASRAADAGHLQDPRLPERRAVVDVQPRGASTSWCIR